MSLFAVHVIMDSHSRNTPQRAKQEDVLREFSYVEKFRTRKRPNLWLFIGIQALIFLAIGAYFVLRGGIPSSAWFSPVLIGIVVLSAFITWTRLSPVCPHCGKNVTICRASHCHVCGELLNAGRCERCGVFHSWMQILRPLQETTGNRQAIKYCSGCGVLLDTDFRRWRGE